MAQMIDPEEVLKNFAVARERYMADREKPGVDGALARLGLAVEEHMTIWRAHEFNRQTNANDILNALMAAFASHIAGLICENGGDPQRQIGTAMKIGASFLGTLISTMNATNAGELEMTKVYPTEMGVA